jgi:hypothetical protein
MTASRVKRESGMGVMTPGVHQVYPFGCPCRKAERNIKSIDSCNLFLCFNNDNIIKDFFNLFHAIKKLLLRFWRYDGAFNPESVLQIKDIP